MSVYRDPDLPDPVHQTLKVYQSLTTQKSILTTQVVAGEFKCAHTGCCMFRWWFILFLCPDIIKEKKSEVEQDIEQNVTEGEEIMKKTLKLLMMYADCTKIMVVKPVWFFTCK